ncbi:acyltransferase family protein [Terriglobus sp.]|uniref:acyltransferase family protein n=1 Tax=Terriglobus sp. TaxID=1889013 RepID=UPI003B00EE8E
MERNAPAAAPRFETVDLLRGLSILAVVLLHCWIRFAGNGIRVGTGLSRWWRHLLLQNGGNGVTVFFAISGFLITLTSLRRFVGLEHMRPGLFYRIRFARIAPLLLLTLAVLSLLHWGSLHSAAFEAWHVKKTVGLPRALLSALTFHLNWLEAETGYLPANWDVMWSLSVEEMFYLFFPLVCVAFLGMRSPVRRAGWALLFSLAGALLVLGPWARSVWITTEIGQEKSYLGGMNAIAMGCLAALWCNRRSRSGRVSRAPLYAVEAVGWALIAWIATWPPWHWLRSAGQFLAKHDLDDTVLPLGVCMVMVASVLRGTRGGGLLTAPVRWFGRHSYEVYLSHEFVVIVGVTAFLRWHGTHPGLWALVLTALTAPLGWAIARWFSEPMNRRSRGARPLGRGISGRLVTDGV